ncbi:hypothetical protein [Paenibacillus nuruki]|nr:hypothetical protein [Paenibacillus nuruki]
MNKQWVESSKKLMFVGLFLVKSALIISLFWLFNKGIGGFFAQIGSVLGNFLLFQVIVSSFLYKHKANFILDIIETRDFDKEVDRQTFMKTAVVGALYALVASLLLIVPLYNDSNLVEYSIYLICFIYIVIFHMINLKHKREMRSLQQECYKLSQSAR